MSSDTFKSTLALLMALIRANHPHHTVATNDLAVTADFFDRSRNFHFFLLKLYIRHSTSIGAISLPVWKWCQLSSISVHGLLHLFNKRKRDSLKEPF